MALVGSYVGLSRLLVAAIPVFLLAWMRFAIAAVAMAAWLRPRPDEPPLTTADRKLLFWESFIGNFGFSICMLFGVAATSAVAAGVVMASIPALVAVLSRVFLGERIEPRVRLAIVLACVGIGTLALARAPDGAPESGGPWWGYALLLGAAVCEAAYVVIGKRLATHVSPQRISAIINLWGLALITPLGLWQAWSFTFHRVEASTWGLLVFYALAASVATVWLWMRGLRQVPAARAGIFTVCLPVSAALVGIVWLQEPFGAAHCAAFAAAMAGLLLATWPAQAAAGNSPP